MAVSMDSTRIMGAISDFMVNSSTTNTVPMATRFTFTMSAVTVSIKS